MQNRKKKIVKIIIIFTLILLVMGGSFLLFVSFILKNMFEEVPDNYSEKYTPTFQDSSFVLVSGDGFSKPYLYYKNDQPSFLGKAYEDIQIVLVSQDTQASTQQKKPIFNLKFLDNHVDEIRPGFIVFHLENGNLDCLAVYQNKKVIPVHHVEIGLLPTPSDSWMCKGFDFKSALQK